MNLKENIDKLEEILESRLEHWMPDSGFDTSKLIMELRTADAVTEWEWKIDEGLPEEYEAVKISARFGKIMIHYYVKFRIGDVDIIVHRKRNKSIEGYFI